MSNWVCDQSVTFSIGWLASGVICYKGELYIKLEIQQKELYCLKLRLFKISYYFKVVFNVAIKTSVMMQYWSCMLTDMRY